MWIIEKDVKFKLKKFRYFFLSKLFQIYYLAEISVNVLLVHIVWQKLNMSSGSYVDPTGVPESNNFMKII